MQAQLESCEAKRTSTVWRKEGPGSAAGPWLHCAHYAWQAGAREGDPSAAGILGAKLVARIREETLHFVPWMIWKIKNILRDGEEKQADDGDKFIIYHLSFII